MKIPHTYPVPYTRKYKKQIYLFPKMCSVLIIIIIIKEEWACLHKI